MNSPSSINHKSTLFINKNILNRDSIFKRLDLQNEYSCEEKAKESQLYRQLQRKFQFTKKQHQISMLDLDQRIAKIEEQIKLQKSSIHDKKIGLWELKNQVMQLNEVIAQDQEQNEHYFQQEEGEGEEQSYQNALDGNPHHENINSYLNSHYSQQMHEAQPPKDLNDLLSSWGIKRQSKPLIQNQY